MRPTDDPGASEVLKLAKLFIDACVRLELRDAVQSGFLIVMGLLVLLVGFVVPPPIGKLLNWLGFGGVGIGMVVLSLLAIKTTRT